MKVLHLGKLCPPNEGGIELFSYDLLEYLNKAGINAELLCFGDITKKDFYKGFVYYSCKMNIKISSAPLSYDFVRTFIKIQKDFNIIHVHSPNPLAEMLSLLSNKKTIIHWHSDIVRQKLSYFFYKPIQQKVLKKADKIICTSPQYLNTSKQLENVREKAVVIPSGLNPERLLNSTEDNKYKEFLEKTKGKKIVLSIGRLVEYKGFKYLVEAGKYLNNDIVIVIIGAGVLYDHLKERIKNLNLKNKVILFGRVNNITNYLKACDIFVLPSISRNEAFGLVLVEALFFGKPIITTNVEGSGMNYVNQHNIAGLVVPPRDPKALADAINKILSDENLYNYFSENAKKRFEKFRIDTIGNKIIKLYKEVLES